MKMRTSIGLLVTAIIYFVACSKSPMDNSSFPVSVSEIRWIDATSVRVIGHADIERLGGAEFGILISENDNPSSDNSREISIKTLNKDNEFSADVLDLNGIYYCVGYYKVGKMYYVSEVSSFSTQVVDLGLCVKWASCNLGASSPEEFGDYFAWGETSPKSSYLESNYTYSGNPSTLPLSADAAQDNLKGTWRMPTEAEFEELLENCKGEWASYKGVGGYKFTSLKTGYEGRWIFLPAAGGRIGTSLGNAGSSGYYWSSSLDTDYPGGAWYLYFDSDNVYTHYNYRFIGRSVRPVSE